MKILYISAKLFNGGAEHVARKNFEIMYKNGHEVMCFTKCDQEVKKYKGIYNNIYESKMKNGKIAYIWSKQSSRELKKILFEFKPDIIHIHSFIPFSPSIGKIIKKYKQILNYKVILTHHTYSMICFNDCLFDYSNDSVCEKCINIKKNKASNCTGKNIVYYYGKKIKAYLWDRYFLGNTIDLHISPSIFLKNKLIESKKYKDEDIEIVYNPCININKKIKYSDRVEEVVYFGRLSNEKNVLILLNVWEELVKEYPIKLSIIGNGPLEEKIKQKLQEKELGNYIDMKGYMSPKTLGEYIKDKKYFILPSKWYENSPVSIIEAYANGLIPLVSNHGGMSEIIDNFNLGYTFKSQDISNIKDTLLEAIKNNHKDYKKIQENIDMVLKQYTLDEYYKRINKIYEKMR